MSEELNRNFNLCSDEEFFKRFWSFVDSQNVTPAAAKEVYKILLENIKVSEQLAKDYDSDEFTCQARHLAVSIAAALGADIEEMSTNGGLADSE